MQKPVLFTIEHSFDKVFGEGGKQFSKGSVKSVCSTITVRSHFY
jgi:hypothetical protein